MPSDPKAPGGSSSDSHPPPPPAPGPQPGRDLFQLLIEHSSDLISLHDRDGIMRYQGPSITPLLGYRPEDLIGHSVMDYIHPEDSAFTSRSIETIRSRPGSHPPFETRFRHKDGSWRWFECTGTNLLDRPEIEHVVFNAHDITDRKRATEALRRSEENFRRLIENISDVIAVLRPDGVIVYQSRSVTRVLGYELDDIIGRNALEFVHPDDVAEIAGAFRSHEREPVRREFRFRHKDGSWRFLEAVGSGIFEDGALAGAVVTARDVTDRHELEDRLRQAQKLESIGLLAGGIAHDFNNMLTVISGYSDMVLEQLEESSPIRQDVMEISKAAGKAAMLTYQLLAFSRKQVLNPTKVNLNDVVSDVSRMVGRLIGEHITLHLALDPALAMAHADANQIAQVVMNLSVNARDAMRQGGRLTIETTNVVLDAAYAATHTTAKTGPHVMLAVSDTGVGMDAATQARVFEPFFTTKGVGEGTGMGLATVYGIIKQSGGNIWVYSEPGHGSAFKIYLPASSDVVAAPGVPDEGGMPLGTERVLLVEDETAVRKLAKQVLEACGYTVVEAEDGRRAIELYSSRTEAFDLLLTDVVMPHLSGRALADVLVGTQPGLAVLYMSGYTANAIVHHGVLEAGIHFVQKPFSAKALARAVRAALDAPGR